MAGTDTENFHVNDQQLETVAETRCANTPKRRLEPLKAEPDKDIIPAVDSTSQAQAMIKTGTSMFIPHCLAECVIDLDLSAREAFEVLWPVIAQKNLPEMAKPLVRFLMVAATKCGTRGAPRTLNDELGFGITGAADIISDGRQRVSHQHLPSLAPVANANASNLPCMDDLVLQLSQLNQHARLDGAARQQARDDASKPKTVCDKFGDCTTNKLLKLTEEAMDDDLPRLCHELAACTKGINK